LIWRRCVTPSGAGHLPEKGRTGSYYMKKKEDTTRADKTLWKVILLMP